MSSTPAPPDLQVLLRPENVVLDGPGTDKWFAQIGTGIAAALRHGEQSVIDAARTAIRRLLPMAKPSAEARLRGILDVYNPSEQSAPARASSDGAGERLEPNTLAARFLEAVAKSPEVSNLWLCRTLETDETQVSRAGARLLELGYVTRVRVGRVNMWSATTKGEKAARAVSRHAAVLARAANA